MSVLWSVLAGIGTEGAEHEQQTQHQHHQQ